MIKKLTTAVTTLAILTAVSAPTAALADGITLGSKTLTGKSSAPISISISGTVVADVKAPVFTGVTVPVATVSAATAGPVVVKSYSISVPESAELCLTETSNTGNGGSLTTGTTGSDTTGTALKSLTQCVPTQRTERTVFINAVAPQKATAGLSYGGVAEAQFFTN